MTTLSILPVTNPTDLLEVYPNETDPQACYITLDICTGNMSARTNPEIGNAVSMDVWHGLVRRYYLPGPMLASPANALMADIAINAQTILDHCDVIWDGSNNVANLHSEVHDREISDGLLMCKCPAVVAERAIEEAMEFEIESEDFISWVEAGDWYEGSGVDEEVARVLAGESVDEVAEEMEREIIDGGGESVVVMGVAEYLHDAVQEENR